MLRFGGVPVFLKPVNAFFIDYKTRILLSQTMSKTFLGK